MKNKQKNTVLGRVALGGLLIVFTILLMISFYNSDSSSIRDLQQKANKVEIFGDERGQNVNLEEVAHKPDDYYGKTISVRGEVGQNIGTRGITIESVGLVDDMLLVISREALVGVGGGPGEIFYSQNDDVRVSGVVREFRIAQIEQELGINLDDETFRVFEGKPVVIADSIAEIVRQ